MLEKITVNLAERSYPIYISGGILGSIGDTLAKHNLRGKAMIITNPTLNGLYGEATLKSINDAGFASEIFVIPDGEIYKNLDTVSGIYDRLISQNYTRQTILIALGGGVVGDITGFAAATYMRGVRFIQIPTSLVAMTDSSVGGKTGVNHQQGKNIIGAFYQPSFVFIDTNLLKTLPEREYIAGLAEVIKYGVIYDGEFFDYLGENVIRIMSLNNEAVKKIVCDSCRIKARVVEEDERESGLRAILNFGHTIGHALETMTSYERYKHGEAIALGMLAASFIACERGMISLEEYSKIEDVIGRFGLPTRLPADIQIDKTIEQLSKDKKVMDNKVRFVLPIKIGETKIVDDVEKEIIFKSLERLIK